MIITYTQWALGKCSLAKDISDAIAWFSIIDYYKLNIAKGKCKWVWIYNRREMLSKHEAHCFDDHTKSIARHHTYTESKKQTETTL